MCFSAYLYDGQDKLVTTRSDDSSEKLIVKLFCLLEGYPLGTQGIVYDHTQEQVIGSYSRRTIE